MTRNCLYCKKEFKTFPSRVKIGLGKYCSKTCSSKVTLFKKGDTYWLGKKRPDLMKTNAANTMFKQGRQTWNKGIEWKAMRAENNPRWSGGKPKCNICGEEVTYGQSLCRKDAMRKFVGDRNIQWKDEGYSMTALHNWVKRHLGKPLHCERCGLSDQKRTYHWANKSGEYKRDLSDWLRLCVPCHKNYDLARIDGKVVMPL